MNISFDFDDTLSREEVIDFAQKLSEAGHTLYITTARLNKGVPNSWNDDLFEVADYLSIPHGRIHFCNMAPKYTYFQRHPEINAHIDDDEVTVEWINTETTTKGIVYSKRNNWKAKLLKIIK